MHSRNADGRPKRISVGWALVAGILIAAAFRPGAGLGGENVSIDAPRAASAAWFFSPRHSLNVESQDAPQAGANLLPPGVIEREDAILLRAAAGPDGNYAERDRVQAAVDLAAERGKELILLGGRHYVSRTVRIPHHHFGIRGVANRTVIAWIGRDEGAIVLDFTGAFNNSIRNLRVDTEHVTFYAGAALYFGRDEKLLPGAHHVEAVQSTGNFRFANLVCIASEANLFTACSFTNTGDAQPVTAQQAAKRPGRYALYWDGSAPAQRLPGAASRMQTAQQATFTACHFGVWQQGPADACAYLTSSTGSITTDLQFIGGGASLKRAFHDPANGVYGLACFVLDPVAQFRTVNILGFRGESTDALYGVYVPNRDALGPRAVENVRIVGSEIDFRKSAIRAEDDIYGWEVTGCNFVPTGKPTAADPWPEWATVDVRNVFQSKFDLANSRVPIGDGVTWPRYAIRINGRTDELTRMRSAGANATTALKLSAQP